MIHKFFFAMMGAMLGCILFFICLGHYEQHHRAAPVFNDGCVYFDRHNEDGSCDNSDPCDPTTLKDPELRGDCRDN